MVINPDICVDCDLCVAECPVGAIYSEDELPEDQTHFLELNAELSLTWPNITAQKAPPVDAEKWDGVQNKFSLLIREA